MMDKETLKIAIVLPSGHLYNTPCVPNLAKYLALNGVEVEVFAVRNRATPQGRLESQNCAVRYFPIEVARSNERVALLSAGFLFWVARSLLSNRYDFVIACGIRGLFVVGLLGLSGRFGYAYNSLELYSGPRFERGPRGWFKRLERTLNQRAQLSIIQDECRAELLSRINGLGAQEICVFPNAPYEESAATAVATQSVRSRYGVKETDRLVICSGSFERPWAGIGKILSVVPRFRKDYVLFLQSRSKLREYPDESLKNRIAEGGVIWSRDPLSAEDYDQLVRDSYIGISWYESEDENIHYVGLSSGKIAHYLRWAKPIVVNRLPLLTGLIEKYGCGVVVDSEHEIGPALEKIDRDYQRYSEGARRAYRELFDMDNYARTLVKAIDAHVKGK